MRIRHLAPIALAGILLIIAQPCAAVSPRMHVSVRGHAVEALTPGMRIDVAVEALPPATHDYCVGLASAVDRSGLPLNLGRVLRDRLGTGRLAATIPVRLFPAEPAGLFLLFVGTCTPVAPDRPFVARTMVHILPATAGLHQ
jgi:hypothetical protein